MVRSAGVIAVSAAILQIVPMVVRGVIVRMTVVPFVGMPVR
jgi:hypothetical protein